MGAKNGGGRLGWEFKGEQEERSAESLLRTVRERVKGIMRTDGDMPAGCFPGFGVCSELEWFARVSIMPQDAAGMDMNSVFFMLWAFMNANEHPFH